MIQMSQTSHLEALQFRLSNEKSRLNNAKNKNEKTFRETLVAQIEKEIQGEIKFLESKGIKVDMSVEQMSDDELMAELLS